jgi:hypothetical protein
VTQDQRRLNRIWGYRLALAKCDNDLDALERIIDELYEADLETYAVAAPLIDALLDAIAVVAGPDAPEALEAQLLPLMDAASGSTESN